MKAHYVTDRQSAGDSRLKEKLAAFSGAQDFSVQLREKDAPDRECLGWARVAHSILGAGVPLYVNRRFDIALAADADGVHLPASGLPIPKVRAVTPRGFRIGVSTHSPGEAAARIAEGADLVLIGPIFDTPSKRAYGPPLGEEALRELPPLGKHSCEVFAIGGISEENLGRLDPYSVGIAFALVVTRLLDYIFFDVAFPLRRKTAAPALLRQLVGLLIFGLCVAVLFKLILPDVSLGAVLTTSAIITAVIGLALQDTLGNLFAGLALHLEKTVQVGDMIRQAETYGTVEELSWRAIKLRTVEGNLLLIPNSVAGRERLEIFPRPGRPIARFLRVGLEYDAPPEQAKEVLQGAVDGLAGLAASPAPVAYVKSFDASAVTYEVRYWLEDYANYLDVDSQVHERVWYALSRAGLAIAYPVIRQHQYAAGKLERPDRRPAIAEAIEKAALFARLPDDQRQRLAGGARETLPLVIRKAGKERRLFDRFRDGWPPVGAFKLSCRVLVLPDDGVCDGEARPGQRVPDPFVNLRVHVQIVRVVFQPVAHLVGHRRGIEALNIGDRGGGRSQAGEAVDGALQDFPALLRWRVVLEAHAQEPGDRAPRTRENLQVLAARHAVGDEKHVSFDRAQLDRSPGKLLDGSVGFGLADHVSDLHGLLQMQGQAGEEVSKRVLESKSDDGRDDRRGRQHGAEAHVRKDQLEEDCDAEAEDEKPHQLPQQRRRCRLAPERERDVEKDVVQQTRDDQREGDPDGERAVVPVLPHVGHRDS